MHVLLEKSSDLEVLPTKIAHTVCIRWIGLYILISWVYCTVQCQLHVLS